MGVVPRCAVALICQSLLTTYYEVVKGRVGASPSPPAAARFEMLGSLLGLVLPRASDSCLCIRREAAECLLLAFDVEEVLRGGRLLPQSISQSERGVHCKVRTHTVHLHLQC